MDMSVNGLHCSTQNYILFNIGNEFVFLLHDSPVVHSMIVSLLLHTHIALLALPATY